MWPPKSKDDLFQYNIEIIDEPSNIQHVIRNDSNGQIILENYYTPTVEEFKILSQNKILKKIGIKDFHKRLKEIIESAIKLDCIAYFFQFDHEEKKDKIQKIIHDDVKNNPFQILMPDYISKKDKIKRNKLLHQYNEQPDLFYSYKYTDEEIIFKKDTPADNFLAISPKREYVVKASFNSQQKIKNVFQKDIDAFLALKNVMKNLHNFHQDKSNTSEQKRWEDFLLQNSFKTSVSEYQEDLINPLIMHLVDQSRRFLYDGLIHEHWQDISNTKQSAQQALKKNKNNIYILSQKFGYINSEKPFIMAENIRNLLAHPSRYSEEKLQTAFDISLLYRTFVYHFIDADFLKNYYDQFPFSFRLQELSNQQNQYQIVRDVDFLTNFINGFIPKEFKDKTDKEKLDFLASKKILSLKETENIKNLILSRNKVAHGQHKNNEKTPQSINDVSKIYHRLFFHDKV